MPNQLSVTLPKNLQRKFKLEACRAHPLEFFAFLLGRRLEDESLDIRKRPMNPSSQSIGQLA
jgi:proteasome lid subunit RPN8/RPN11